MKQVKTLLFYFACFILVLLVSTRANAQQKQYPSPKQFANYATNRMVERLNLTPEQEQKVYNINLQYATSCYANMGDLEQLNQFRQARDRELQNVLNQEQYQNNLSLSQQNSNYYNQTCWGPYWGMSPQYMGYGYGGEMEPGMMY